MMKRILLAICAFGLLAPAFQADAAQLTFQAACSQNPRALEWAGTSQDFGAVPFKWSRLNQDYTVQETGEGLIQAGETVTITTARSEGGNFLRVNWADRQYGSDYTSEALLEEIPSCHPATVIAPAPSPVPPVVRSSVPATVAIGSAVYAVLEHPVSPKDSYVKIIWLVQQIVSAI